MAKQGLYQGLRADIETQLRYDSLAYDILLPAQAHQEGVRALVEKGQPVFKGK